MTIDISYILFIDVIYILFSFIYLLFLWKDGQRMPREEQAHWRRRNIYWYFAAISAWSLLIGGLCTIFLIRREHSVPLLGFATYYVITGCLFYVSGMWLLSKIYSIHNRAFSLSLVIFRIILLISGAGTCIGILALLLTLIPFSSVMTHNIWYLVSYFVFVYFLVNGVTSFVEREIKRRADVQSTNSEV